MSLRAFLGRRRAARAAGSAGPLSRWLAGRLPRQDTQRLTHRNVYILPTRAGALLAAVLAVLLVASINYQLNLGYLLTFLLAGSALAGMHAGHANLRNATLHLLPPAPAFAGDAAMLEVQIASDSRAVRHALALGVMGSTPRAWTDVPGGGIATVRIAWTPPARGEQPLPPLVAETRFPMGTFRVWTVWRPAASLLVYPRPETPTPPLPAGEPQAQQDPHAVAGRAGTGDPDGVRGYRRGDPQRLVVWKKAAQAIAAGSDTLVSRDATSTQRQDLWLDLQQAGATGLSGRELQLSRLCAWVLQADRLGLAYGLRLPGTTLASSTGARHLQACLEALARC
ncbi:DUF58 domain-containing protein [uncultured Xylophilus sp.]|uniref:DUF58 domain-containing protein n=1 Tax=uncultured Xylophilus sp. TaxID=296832 RepID=UPI0025F878B8|nr:DUF58 domain-containing protein [uncultured Xylophilus sp.]